MTQGSFCSGCGAPIPAGVHRCPNCGSPLGSAAPPPPPAAGAPQRTSQLGAIVAVLFVVAVAAAVIFVVTRGGDEESGIAAGAQSTATTVPTTATSAAPVTTAAPDTTAAPTSTAAPSTTATTAAPTTTTTVPTTTTTSNIEVTFTDSCENAAWGFTVFYPKAYNVWDAPSEGLACRYYSTGDLAGAPIELASQSPLEVGVISELGGFDDVIEFLKADAVRIVAESEFEAVPHGRVVQMEGDWWTMTGEVSRVFILLRELWPGEPDSPTLYVEAEVPLDDPAALAPHALVAAEVLQRVEVEAP